jgi:hypothetical protein
MTRHDAVAAPDRVLFGDDEPVIQSHSLLDGAVVPRFGDTVVWDFNGVVRRPAKLQAAAWRLNFSEELTDPVWNLLAREIGMIYFNRRHPVVIAAGLSLRPRPANPATVIGMMSHLRRMARWAGEQGIPDLSAWGGSTTCAGTSRG